MKYSFTSPSPGFKRRHRVNCQVSLHTDLAQHTWATCGLIQRPVVGIPAEERPPIFCTITYLALLLLLGSFIDSIPPFSKHFWRLCYVLSYWITSGVIRVKKQCWLQRTLEGKCSVGPGFKDSTWNSPRTNGPTSTSPMTCAENIVVQLKRLHLPVTIQHLVTEIRLMRYHLTLWKIDVIPWNKKN